MYLYLFYLISMYNSATEWLRSSPAGGRQETDVGFVETGHGLAPGMLPSSFAHHRSNYKNRFMTYTSMKCIWNTNIWISNIYIRIIYLDCCQGCCIHTALIDIGGQIRFYQNTFNTGLTYYISTQRCCLHSSLINLWALRRALTSFPPTVSMLPWFDQSTYKYLVCD